MMKRYPGSVPFEKTHKDIFFGREADTERLYRFINVNKISVLHGKSGLGKTSLLNAGLVPRLEEDGYLCVKIRFTSWNQAEAGTTPSILFRTRLRQEFKGEQVFLPEIENEEAHITLWQQLKELEWQNRDKKGILLVFDQFEEVFTYPEGVERFGEEFADLVHNRMPLAFQEKLYGKINDDPAFLAQNAEQVDFIEHSKSLRVLLSIRSDRMSFLNRLVPWLPEILRNCYELLPLDLDQARRAITEPAGKTGDFQSAPFQYSDAAVRRILDYLSENGTRPIESFQLQVLCQHVEQQILAGALAPPIDAPDLGNIEDVYQNFYGSMLAQFPPTERLAVQRFIEEGLIFEYENDERRLSLYEKQAEKQWNIAPETLRRLVDLHLLRTEPSPFGGFMYELCHDSMVGPILKIKRLRTQEERRLAAEQARMEQEARDEAVRAQLRAEAAAAERRRHRAVLIALGALLLSAFAVGAGLLAWRNAGEARRQTVAAEQARAEAVLQKENAERAADEALRLKNIAEEERRRADAERQNAVKQQGIAREQARIAREQTTLAETALARAQAEETKARQAAADLQIQRDATEAQKQEALRNAAEAERQRKLAEQRLDSLDAAIRNILKKTLEESRSLIQQLRYLEALDKLSDAAAFGKKEAELARQAQEMGFVFNEAGLSEPALTATGLAWQTHPKPPTAPPALGAGTPNLQANLRGVLHELDPAAAAALQKMYFPDMVTVEGGTFSMGCRKSLADCAADELPAHSVAVSTFHMARTEVSVRQFYLFCLATGRSITDFAPDWGLRDEHPVVKVTWFDAAQYANWLNTRQGLLPVYVFAANGALQEIRSDAAAGAFRLPTEAEWEFAATGGRAQDVFDFSGGAALDSVGWYGANSFFKGESRTTDVATKKANRLGLYDLSGSVREWCEDFYAAYPAAAQTNPRRMLVPGNKTEQRVLRGGAFNSPVNFCTVSVRQGNFPGGRDRNIGFRVAN